MMTTYDFMGSDEFFVFLCSPILGGKNWPCNRLYLEHMVVKGDLLNDQELIDLNWLDLQYPCFPQKMIFKPWVNYGDGYISGHLHTVNWEPTNINNIIFPTFPER